MLISFAGLPSDAEVRSASQTERSDQEGKTCKGLNQIFVIVVVIIAVLILVPLIKAANEMTRNLRICLSYLLQVLALIVGELHEAMPVVFGKEAKKKNLLKHLEQTIEVGCFCCYCGWSTWKSLLW